MRRFLLIVLLVACQRDRDDNKKVDLPNAAPINATSSTAPKTEQIKPPIDIKTPPADAVKTSSGLIYKKLVEKPDAPAPKRNDAVLINYTGWRHTTGETFFTNRSTGQPMRLDLATTAAGFTEAMQLVKKGEKVMLWIPPEIGYKTAPQGKPEMLVYEVEVAEILPAPAVPPDFNAPPPEAKPLKSGARVVKLKGDGKEKARSFDTVTFDYTAWDNEGRMFDSTEMRKRPAIVPPFRQAAVMEEILTTFAVGDRIRFWVESEKMAVGGKTSGLPAGLLCYELEVKSVEKAPGTPPPVPPDVKAPPAGAKKTEKGVFYRVLKTGKGGPKPTATDSVKVNYTGWGTDGRMFDSSEVRAQPADFALNGVIAGWTDGLQVMSVGDRVRFWIPEELAYKGSPGKPQGMLVFDIELLEIKSKPAEQPDDGHGHGGHGEPPKTADQPAPPDVAAPPKDAKQTAKGVFYKILSAKKGAAKPKPTDTIKVNYTGWKTNGEQFDSSAKHGGPSEFSLQRVIEGWTDGFQQIGVGEKARLWIPERLAYGGEEPSGMLVFDVELLEIKPKQ